VASLCHPWFTTTNLSYRFPIFKTSATALCGTTGTNKCMRYTIPIDPAHPATIQRPSNDPKAIAILLRRASLGAARTRRHCEYWGGVVWRRRWLSGRWVPYGPLVFCHQRDGNSEKRLQEYPWTIWETLIFDVMNFPRFFPEVCLFHPCPPTKELGATRNSEYWWIMMNIVFFWNRMNWENFDLLCGCACWFFSPQNLEERELCMTLRFPKPGDYSS
jgi:hypothetical protein